MLRTEERTIPLSNSPGADVQGIVRVRAFRVGGAGRQFVFEQHDPVAVTMRVNGEVTRVSLETPRRYGGVAAYVGLALAARAAARILSHRARRRT